MTLRAVADGSIFVDLRDGATPPVLTLHGWGRNREDLQLAVDGYQTIAVDLPGFGLSPQPPKAWGAKEYADAVGGMLDEITAQRVIVVGHSFGGRVGACLAANFPSRVAGLVIIGTPLLRREPSHKPPLKYRVARIGNSYGLVPDKFFNRIRRAAGSDDYNAASGRMREILVRVVNEDYRDQLNLITCPVAFCWGKSDTAAPPSIAVTASALVPNLSTLTIISGAGHDVHKSNPEAVKEAIDEIVRSL